VKPIQTNNSYDYVPKATLSSSINHQISCANALLMHDVMNNALSHKAKFDQFHMKMSYIMMFSCFMSRIKFKRCCSNIDFDGLFETIGMFPVLIENNKLDHKLIN
jgi:hypothetical protein